MTGDRRNKYREFDPKTIEGFLDERQIVGCERISSGKSNTNFKLELSDGERVVVRLYSENSQSSPARESTIARMIGGQVPLPTMLDHGDDWAVYEFVEGSLLGSVPENSAEAAKQIAVLSRIHLDSVGWITQSGEIAPFDFGDDYYGTMLKHSEVRRWLGTERIPVLEQILEGENARLDEIHGNPSLTHGDFNPTNVLIDDGEVSAVLDWEYGHAGTPYMDIGNLLRNTDSQYHDAIGQGLREGGFDLPPDWRQRAVLIDVSSHLEFLTSTRSDEFKRTRVELIDSFIKMFR